jgi:hypothetical protein
MPENEGKLTAETRPSVQMIGPGEQGSFEIGNDRFTLSVTNDYHSDSGFLYVWIYASETAVTPATMVVPSYAVQTLRAPGPDSSGNKIRTLVIYNTGGATLTCTIRTE